VPAIYIYGAALYPYIYAINKEKIEAKILQSFGKLPNEMLSFWFWMATSQTNKMNHISPMLYWTAVWGSTIRQKWQCISFRVVEASLQQLPDMVQQLHHIHAVLTLPRFLYHQHSN